MVEFKACSTCKNCKKHKKECKGYYFSIDIQNFYCPQEEKKK